MDALPIDVAVDVGEQVAASLVPGRPSSLVNEFDLKSMEEALHGNVDAPMWDKQFSQAWLGAFRNRGAGRFRG
jgi:hypothetical protein